MPEYKKLWEEFVKDSENLNLSSLKMKKTLNTDIWDKNNFLKGEITQKLIKIAYDFYENLDLDAPIDDITITGSMSGYNWSNLSDIDVHILIDFSKIDKNIDLVREFFSGKIFVWNTKHDITIYDHEVEIYVQNTIDLHVSESVYSVMNKKWIVKPRQYDPKIDFAAVKEKALRLIDYAKRLYLLFEDEKYREVVEFGNKFKKKIRKMRKMGLKEAGIFSNENLAFKILRRNGYLGYINDIIGSSYDNMHSLGNNFSKKIKIYIKKEEKQEIKGFQHINEMEKYQNMIHAGHSLKKKDFIGYGKQKNTPPFTKKPNYNRNKSAPPDV